MDIFSWKRDLHDLQRLRTITTILVEEGFHEYLARAGLSKHAKIHTRMRHAGKRTTPTPEHIRKTLERLGPTFVKLGQVLSLRPDLIPHEYCEEFKKLQDDAEPLPYATVKRVVEEQIGKPLSKAFSKFSKRPLAAASISQVHRATLHNGREVVVKIQRPGIPNVMERDIDIMLFIAKKVDQSKAGHRLHALGAVQEFQEYTRRELDFRIEFQNTKVMHKFFEDNPDVVIPQPIEEYSTGVILVLEYIDGIPCTDLDRLKKEKFDLKKLMHVGAQAILKQVFEGSFFHADPHPGNLMGVKRGKRHCLAFLDFGIVGYLDQKTKQAFIQMFSRIIEKDVEGTLKGILDLGEKGPECDINHFRQELTILISSWDPNDLETGKMSSLVYKTALLAIESDILLPSVVITCAKALVTIEGAAIWMDPHISIANEAGPYLGKLISQEYGPDYIAREAKHLLPEMKSVIDRLPGAAETFVQRVQDGRLEFKIDGKELGAVVKDYDLEMERRNHALLAGMLFIGSALLAGLSPELALLGTPVHVIGFVLAAVFLIGFMRKTRQIHKNLREELL